MFFFLQKSLCYTSLDSLWAKDQTLLKDHMMISFGSLDLGVYGFEKLGGSVQFLEHLNGQNQKRIMLTANYIYS